MEVVLAGDADPQALLRELASRVTLTRFEIVEPSMHDIFVERVEATTGAVPAPPVADEAAQPAAATSGGKSRSCPIPLPARRVRR